MRRKMALTLCTAPGLAIGSAPGWSHLAANRQGWHQAAENYDVRVAPSAAAAALSATAKLTADGRGQLGK